MVKFAFSPIAVLLFVTTVVTARVKVVLSNDDGWAAANIRAQNAALELAGYNVSHCFSFFLCEAHFVRLSARECVGCSFGACG